MSEYSKNLVQSKPKVVVIGAGFGGLTAVKTMFHHNVDITLIDKHNYHLFQPLLYQVATAALSASDIAYPIRTAVRRQKNANVVMDTVTGIDKEKCLVITQTGHTFPYDYLIVATGARHSYFGNDHWSAHAPGLKNITDALEVRRHILTALEHAELEHDLEKRKSYTTFVVVGGGPTGVEMAGAIAELSRHAIKEDFSRVTSQCSKVILLEGSDRLLNSFPEDLSAKAKKALEQLGVEVRLNAMVENVNEDGVIISGEKLSAKTVLWAAGVKASHAGQWLHAETDRTGRVIVDEHMNIPNDAHVFVIGDTASYTDKNGLNLPGIAPVAKQQGKHVAKVIHARMNQKNPPEFHYRNYGNLATIGRKYAVIDLGLMKMSGFIAWFLWGIAHIYFLIGFRNRFVVTINWIWSYITLQRGARIIMGDKTE